MLKPRNPEEWSALLADAVELRASTIWSAVREELDSQVQRFRTELADMNLSEVRLRQAQGGFNAASAATLVLEAIIRQAKHHLSSDDSVESRDAAD